VDSTHQFGAPRLTKACIRTDVIASQFRAGDSIAAVARWMEVTTEEVETAIRWEMLDRRRKKRLIEKAGAL
jgi:uncharacterized protein (DUF433 family)